MSEIRKKDIFVIGFALFAMFFGAGNLIFPPDLGIRCGESWVSGFLFYYLADLGLGVIAVMAMVILGGRVEQIAEPLGMIPSTIIATAIILCIGPGLAIPRTAATTYELGIVPLFGISQGKVSLAVLSAVFFLAVLVLAIRPNKVVDIIGNILTPVLLISLLVLILKGILSPAGNVGDRIAENVVKEGILNGYQTLDMLAAIFFSVLMLNSIVGKGYNTRPVVKRLSFAAAMLASALLFVVYGGLAYLGASSGSLWKDAVADGELNQAVLLINITYAILGRPGIAILAIVVTCACLTTSIGLVSAAAEYFEGLLKEKLSYKQLVCIICVYSAITCNLGLTRIISISAPILNLLYPVTILMVVTAFMRKQISSVIPYRAAAFVTFIISIIEVGAGTFGIEIFDVLDRKLPFHAYGFSWLVPASVTFAVCAVLVGKTALRGSVSDNT